MDYRIHRKFSRKMFNINLILTVIYLLSLVAVYMILVREFKERYYIETNNGFMVPITQCEPSSQDRPITRQFFG